MRSEGTDGEELPVPVCSGAVALRRVTSLLASARRADTQGEYHEACELYAEALSVQRTLSRAPLGSIGKSLRDAAAGVEVRLQQLRNELGEANSTTCSGSRPTTNNSAPSSSSKHSAPGASTAARSARGGRGSSLGREEITPPRTTYWNSQLEGQMPSEFCGAAQPSVACWGAAVTIPGCAAEALRPCALEGGRWHGRAEAAGCGRPATRDGARMHLQPNQPSLDGVRPSTRNGTLIQQMINGSGRSSSMHAGQRPPMQNGVRPPTRDGPPERRGQDVSIRKVAGRRKRHQHSHDEEVCTVDTPRGHLDTPRGHVATPRCRPSPERQSFDLLE